MVTGPQTGEFYDFGGFRLDLKKHRLWRGDEMIALTPKEFELLLMLVENAGRIVEKDDLHERIWKDTFVEDGTLTRNISWLRKKLGSGDEGGEKFIETLPKRGYRFLPEVTKGAAPTGLVVEEHTQTHIRVEETITLPGPPPVRADGLEVIEARPIYQLQPPAASRKFWLAAALSIVAVAAIGFAVYKNFFSRAEAGIVVVNKLVPFSGLPGREDSPAFSPDGRQLAFIWNGGGEETANVDVYIKLIGAGEPVRLTKNPADDLSPAYSPDGSHIAFVRTFPTHSELFMIPALGGAERKICNLRSTRSSISFSPDGGVLAVQDGDDLQGIFLVDVKNGEKRRLTSAPEYGGDDRPRFSPDGSTIAFIRSTGSVVQDLFLISPAGGEPRQLTFDKSWINGVNWSADGKKVIFASMRGSNSQTTLWQIAAAGGEPQMIGTGGKSLGNPAAGPDGRTIAFVEDSRDANIWRIEPERLAERDGFRKFIASSRNDNSPHFSADGKRIVFASDRTANYAIWIANADGSGARQLSDLQNAPAGSPRFSPDGQTVVFDAQVAGNGDIYTIPADGGMLRRLTEADSFDFMPAWSSDGRSIYFASNRGGDDQIWKMPATGGEAIQVTKSGGRESFESPDGTELYFSKKGITGLWRITTTGGEESAVPELAEAGYWRAWTVTRQGVYFVARAAGPPYQIKFYDLKSGEVKDIATVEKPPVWVFPSLSASADGKTILYTQMDQNASSIVFAEIGQ